MHQARVMEMSDARAVAAQVIREQWVPQNILQSARDAVQSMCQEAQQYGLTEADVIRALLTPTFDKKRGCDCSGCRERRSQAEEEQLRRWRTESLQQVA